MATKKKAAPKKAARKVTKVTKKPVKKVSPLKGRKLGPRKSKIEQDPVNTGADQAQNGEQLVDRAHDDQMDAVGAGVLGTFGIGYGEAQSNSSVLREIEVIDLRGLDDKNRFGVLCMLDSEGYITSTVESLLKSDNLLVGLEADTLVLNHQNKLVRPATWEEASANSARISQPSLRLNVQIGFSLPSPAYQDVLSIGDATYVRVN